MEHSRVAATSTGYVVISYSGSGWGDIEIFDADGWRTKGAVWGMRGYPDSARELLAEHTALTPDEIERVTSESDAQYKTRGGDPNARPDPLPRELKWVLAGLGVASTALFVSGLLAGRRV